MRYLGRAPALIAMLVLAAHYFRGAQYAAAAACVVATALFFARHPVAVVLSRVLLLAACGVWVVTAMRLAEARRAFGEPYLRMALILGGVAALTALAAIVLPGADRADDARPPGGLE